MNEEWWGIVAKGPADSRGQFQLYPRAAFYGLQQAYHPRSLRRKAPALACIGAHFAAIEPSGPHAARPAPTPARQPAPAATAIRR